MALSGVLRRKPRGGETANGGRRSINLTQLSILAIIGGGLIGGVAVLFRALVAAIHNLFFFGRLNFYYDPNQHTALGPLGPLIILSPVIGGIVVVFLLRSLPPERRGQGVSDVIDAIYYREGKVRPWSATLKSLAAGITSGSGGSVGREAAVIQMGAAIASQLAIFRKLPLWQRMTVTASGAAAGLAAAFNTPLGAIIFAVELMMPEISARTFLPVTIAAGTATFVTRLFYGLQPVFRVRSIPVTEFHIENFLPLLPFTFLGILIGLLSWFLIWVLGWLEQQFARISGSPYVRHALGMLMVGLLAAAMMYFTGHYYVEGAGYSTIQDILRDHSLTVGFLLLLLVTKLIATPLTLGSGGVGGVFSASLVLGAAGGAAFGAALDPLLPGLHLHNADFAIVGMAAMLGSTTGAPLTAIVMVFEMTRDYDIIVPMILCVMIAHAVRREFIADSVYTVKLAGKGHEVPTSLHANMYLVRHASKAVERRFIIVPGEATFAEVLRQLAAEPAPTVILVAQGQRLKGYLPPERMIELLREGAAGEKIASIARRNYVLAQPRDTMFKVIGRLARRKSGLAVVVAGHSRIPRTGMIRGVISVEDLGHGLIESVRVFAEGHPRNFFVGLLPGRLALWLRQRRIRRFLRRGRRAARPAASSTAPREAGPD
jgi:CIC family chloride channel protein